MKIDRHRCYFNESGELGLVLSRYGMASMQPEFMYDKRIVTAVLNKVSYEEICNIIKTEFSHLNWIPPEYMWDGCHVAFIDPRMKFTICFDEYDGESIMVYYEQNWYTVE